MDEPTWTEVRTACGVLGFSTAMIRERSDEDIEHAHAAHTASGRVPQNILDLSRDRLIAYLAVHRASGEVRRS